MITVPVSFEHILDPNAVFLLEKTTRDLDTDARNAFPNTTRRQHRVHLVRVVSLDFTPYVGVRTLFASGVVQGETARYNSMILFTGVKFHKEHDPGTVELVKGGRADYFEPVDPRDSQVRVRCNCPDFYYRFNFYDARASALFGKSAKAPSSPRPANPRRMPGICKHLMAMAEEVLRTGYVRRD